MYIFMEFLHGKNWRGWIRNLCWAQPKVRVMKAITRCAATNVNPETAERDLKILHALVKNYQHNYLGIYLEVLSSGEIKKNEEFCPPV